MSNYNVDTLENKIIVEAQEALKQLDQIIGNVNKAKSSIESMRSATGLKSIDKEAKQATSSLTKMQLITKNLKKALNFSGLIYGAKKAYDFMQSSAKNSIDYVETLNLFEVSMGKTLDAYGNIDKVSSQYYTKALDFQQRLNEAFGTNIEETMRYQALYNQMTKSMGVGDNASYVISENLTKLGIDLASLFNKSESATMEALRAGVLAGQTKPLRNYGLDVTQNSLKPLLASLGIDRSMSELSQAEKMILRYIAVLKQASAAHGDFAKTIESPANQLKVLKSQFNELKTAIGNLFQGLLGQVLPYVNAVIMVIKELVKMIGSLFGFKVSSSNTNLAEKVGVDDLDTGLSSAVGSAKALKAQLMGFDEINNITTETSSGGGGGSISPTGIDNRLLDALGEYDNLMGKVKMKATEIRDKIMDWLGFTKVLNPLTGETSWKLREGWTNLKKIWTIIKGFLGLALITKIIKLTGYLRNLFVVLKTGQATGLTPFFSGLTGLKNAFIYSEKQVGKHSELLGKLNSHAVLAAAGVVGLGTSMFSTYKIMGQYNEGTINTTEMTQKLGISLAGAAASGAMIGSAFGPWGIAIGAATGALITGIEALILYDTEADKTKKIIKELSSEVNKNHNEWTAMTEAINETVSGQMSEINYSKNLVTELKSLVDANGKVKEGYEGRVEFILNSLNKSYGTEYKLIDGQIQKYGELINTIEATIEAKKREILSEDYASMYEQAIKQRDDFFNKYKEAQKTMSKADNELRELLGENYKYFSDMCEGKISKTEAMVKMTTNLWGTEKIELLKIMDNWSEAAGTLNIAANDWKENCTLMAKYEEYLVAESEGNTDEMERLLRELSVATESELAKQYGYTAYYLDQAKNDVSDTSHEMYQTQIDNLVATTRGVKELSEDQAGAWKYLADNDKNKYQEGLKGLDEDTRKLVQSATGAIISETKNALPEVETASSDIKNVITKNMDGTFSINFGLNANYSELKNKLISMRDTISKMASVPIVGSAFAKYKDNIQSLINQLSVNGYASGGLPDIGEIFVAREAGPELVGKIGRRTAVANNAQIVEAVSKGVFEAVSAAMPGGSTVSLDIRADEGIIVKKAVKGIKEFVTQTGELPFPVPV